MQEEAPQHILERIQKLLNLAEGAKDIGSLNEAENAAAQAQKLLVKYNLSLMDVEEGTVVETISKEIIKTMSQEKKSEGTWISDLWNVIATHNYCKVLFFGRGKWHISLHGEKHNRMVVNDLVVSLIPRIRGLTGKYRKNYLTNLEEGTPEWMIEKKGTWTRGFLKGAVQGINSKLNTQSKHLEETMEGVQEMGLMKRDQMADYIAETYPKLGSCAPSRTKGHSGHSQGYEAGKNLSINRGINGQSGRKLIN